MRAAASVASGFGTKGEVDIDVPYNSVPGIFRNVVIVGANTPPGTIGGIGNARAFDARTGAKLWEFSSVAQPGSVGHDTWEGDSWKGRLGANAWPFYFTIDEQRGLLYLPLASPIPGAFGGDRKGANLFGNSVVAVNVQTGAVHMALSDHPSRPVGSRSAGATRTLRHRSERTDDTRARSDDQVGLSVHPESRDRPADLRRRRAGGSEERCAWGVRVSDAADPVKPPALARVAYSAADLVTAADTTPEHAQAAPSLSRRSAVSTTPARSHRGDTVPKALHPRPRSGFREGWAARTGAAPRSIPHRDSYSWPRRTSARLGSIEKAKDGSLVPYEKTTPARSTFDVRIGDANWPCQKPPWGRLTAINTSTGEFAWQVPLGITDQLPLEKQHTGRPLLAGPIVTASGLVFIASTDDNRFRALDVKTGKELWVDEARAKRQRRSDHVSGQERPTVRGRRRHR